MKKKNSLKHVEGQIVRRGKRLYVVNKKNPRKKRRQG